MRTDTITPAPAASADRPSLEKAVAEAIDQLDEARIESLITMSLLNSELSDNPNDPGFSYGLTREQQEMIGHVAYCTLKSIQGALRLLEAAR